MKIDSPSIFIQQYTRAGDLLKLSQSEQGADNRGAQGLPPRPPQAEIIWGLIYNVTLAGKMGKQAE
jgi:hypothetical protein